MIEEGVTWDGLIYSCGGGNWQGALNESLRDRSMVEAKKKTPLEKKKKKNCEKISYDGGDACIYARSLTRKKLQPANNSSGLPGVRASLKVCCARGPKSRPLLF
jgi:hypothetical protein